MNFDPVIFKIQIINFNLNFPVSPTRRKKPTKLFFADTTEDIRLEKN